MATARLASPASSESSLSFRQSPFSTHHVVNLSFRQTSDGYNSSTSEDEFEMSLPEDDDYDSVSSPPPPPSTVRRKSSYYRRTSSVWSSSTLLTIEEHAREEAAAALLRLRKPPTSTPASFHSEFVENLSNIFALANLHLEDEQKKQSSIDHDSSALQTDLQTRQQEFERDAEASISRFLAEQKKAHDEHEAALRKAQEERTEAARLESERVEKQKQAERAAEEAKRKLEQESALEKERSAAIETDNTTLWPLQQLKSVPSLQRFCKSRAELFSALDAQAKNAPFSPDKQLFLECNEILNRFVPSSDAVSATVKEITAILSKAGDRLDIHLCNFAVSFLKQVQNKVFQNPNYALGFARLLKAIGAVIPRSAIVILAGFFARCPPAALNLEPTSQEPTPAQTGSLRALLRVFCCFIQRSDEQASDFAWCWISSVCSLPVTVFTAPNLLMFLEVSQILKFKFFERYGRQGRKLVQYVASNVVPLLPTSGGVMSTDVQNLKTFFDVSSLRKIPERSFILSCLQSK